MQNKVKKNSYFYTQASLIFSTSLFIFSMNVTLCGQGMAEGMGMLPAPHRETMEARDRAIKSVLSLCISKPAFQDIYSLVQSYEDSFFVGGYCRPLSAIVSFFVSVSGPRQLAIDYMGSTIEEQKERKKQLKQAVATSSLLGVENALKNGAYVERDHIIIRWLLKPISVEQEIDFNITRLLLAEGAGLPSLQKILTLTDNVKSIEFVLNNSKKLNQKELESLLGYAKSDSVVSCLLRAGAGMDAARKRKRGIDFNGNTVQSAGLNRFNNLTRTSSERDAEKAVEVLKEVVRVEGFDGLELDSFFKRRRRATRARC